MGWAKAAATKKKTENQPGIYCFVRNIKKTGTGLLTTVMK
jgi:hypothetical protein